MGWLKNMMDEHVVVLRIAEAFGAYAENLEKNGAEKRETLDEILELARLFTERCHHAKEEKSLFPLLAKKDIGKQLIEELLHEHMTGNYLVDSISNGEKDEKIKGIKEYTVLLRNHIIKENKFFMDADKELDMWERDMLMNDFDEIESRVLGREGRKKCLDKAMEFRKNI